MQSVPEACSWLPRLIRWDIVLLELLVFSDLVNHNDRQDRQEDHRHDETERFDAVEGLNYFFVIGHEHKFSTVFTFLIW